LLEKRKAVRAVPKLHESDFDSDQAHEDDDDVEDHADVVAKYHKDANAAKRESAPSRKCKMDKTNQVEGTRSRTQTKDAPRAVFARLSEHAFENDEMHKYICKTTKCTNISAGCGCLSEKGGTKTPEEVELDKKLGAIITATELMYTWDERVLAEAERLRRETEKWWTYSPFSYEERVRVIFLSSEFPTRIVHEGPLIYVVTMPDLGDDDMPIGLGAKVIAAYPNNLGPFVSRNETDPIKDCFTIQKSDKQWRVEKEEEPDEEPSVQEEDCEASDEGSDEGSDEDSEDSEESEAEDSEDSDDEDSDKGAK